MEEVDKIKEISESIRHINQKFRLLKLLRAAKEEYDRNNYEGCVDNCLRLLEINPENPVALRGLGCSMQSLGKPEEAIRCYSEALRYSEKKEVEYTLLGTIYYIQNNFEEALKYYNLAIDNNEDYEPAYEGRNQAMLENHLMLVDLQDELIEREIRENQSL
jgi:tetratricopeptide (TPR) repeat protein